MESNDIKVYENFLNPEDFKKIADWINGINFPWYYNPCINELEEKQKNFQFTHSFFDKEKEYIRSPLFHNLETLINKINPFILIRVKANLLTKTEIIKEHDFHCDYLSTRDSKITTGIFYLNTNNGYTKFENGLEIPSVSNTFVEFDSNISHTGTTCTNSDCRIVLNLNYIY